MKKIVVSVFACTAVLAFIACGKTASVGSSSSSATSTATTTATSTQEEKVQKPTRVNQESRISPGVQKKEK